MPSAPYPIGRPYPRSVGEGSTISELSNDCFRIATEESAETS